MIPIKNPQGAVIGFGGRTLQDLTNNINYDASKVPKYLNSPETMLFKKSATLFGLDVARRAIGTERVAVFVEGYFDVISLHDIGVENAVGVLGTAITKEHLEAAARASKDGIIVLLMDSDKAGQTAVERCCTQVLSQSDLGRLDVRIASFTSLLSQNSNGLTHELVKDASDLCSLSTNRADTFALVKGVIDNAVGWKQWMAERIILRGVKPIASSNVMLMNNDDDMLKATDELRRDTASLSRVLKNLSIFIASLPDRADRTVLSFYCSEKLAGNNDGLKATLDGDLSQMIEAQAAKFWGAAKYEVAKSSAIESSRVPIVNRSMMSARPKMAISSQTDNSVQMTPAKGAYSPDSSKVKPPIPPPVYGAQSVKPVPSPSLGAPVPTNTIKSTTSTTTGSSSIGVTKQYTATGSVAAPPLPTKTNPDNDRIDNRAPATAMSTNIPVKSINPASNVHRNEVRPSTAAAAAYTPSVKAVNPGNAANRNENRMSIPSAETPSVKKISVNITNDGSADSADEIFEIDIDQLSESFQQSQYGTRGSTKRRPKYGSTGQYQDPVIWEQASYDDSTLSWSNSNTASRIRDAEALVLSAYCLIPDVRDIIDSYLKRGNPHTWVDRTHAYVWDTICRIDTQDAGVITENLRERLAVTPAIENIINGDIVQGKEMIGMGFAVKDAIRVLSSANSFLAQSKLLLELYNPSSETGARKDVLLEKLTSDVNHDINPFTGSLTEQYELELQRDRIAKKIDSVIGTRIDKEREKHGDNLDEVELLFWESADLGDDDSSEYVLYDLHNSTAVNDLNDPIAADNKYVFEFDENESHAILEENALSEEEIKLKEVYNNGYSSSSQGGGGGAGGDIKGVTFGLDDVYEDNYSKKKPYSRGPGGGGGKAVAAKEKKYDWRDKTQSQKLFSGSIHNLTRGSKRFSKPTEQGKGTDIIPDGWVDMGVKKIETFDDSPDTVW